MGKVVYLMGRSCSGKDTLYKRLLEQEDLQLHTVVLYTTRPIRSGEQDGVEYHFTDEAGFLKLRDAGKIIEERVYNTVQGKWRYFTVFENVLFLDKEDYVMIGTLESYEKIRNYLGQDKVIPVLVELEDGVLLQRALDRENRQEKPLYAEMCRRFLADEKDFAKERVQALGITKSFENNDLDKCLEEIIRYIKENL